MNQPDYLTQQIQEIKRKIASSKTVSIDIFDTIVNRPVLKPEHTFYFLHQYIESQSSPLYLPFDFAKERIRAEAQTREKAFQRGYCPDVVALDEIYKEFKKNTYLSKDIVEKIKKYEIEYEIQNTMENKLMGELYRYALSKNKQIFLLSDTYLPIEAVILILKNQGISKYDRLIISSDSGLCKSDGSMYAELIGQGVGTRRWIHVGDNDESDFIVPSSLGIKSFLIKGQGIVVKTIEVLDNKTYEDESSKLERIGYLKKQSYLSWTNHYSDPKQSDFWWQLGNNIGGHMLIGFINWLQYRLDEDKVQTVLFLARDGQIMQEVFKAQNKLSPTKIKSVYCYASRRLLNFAAIYKLKSEDINFLVSGSTPTKAIHYFERINLNLQQAKKIINLVGLRPSKTIKSNDDYQKLKAAFWLSAKQIEKQAAKERQIIKHYLESLKIVGKNVAIVDIGWHGSMQRSLEKIIKNERIDCKLRGYYFGLHAQPTDRKNKKAYFDELDNPILYAEIIRGSVEVAELFFSANHPTIVGLKKNGSKTEPVFGIMSPTRVNINALQKGIKDFANQYYSSLENIKYVHPSPAIALSSLKYLILSPSKTESQKIGNIRHYEGFGNLERRKDRPIVSKPHWYNYLVNRKAWRKSRDYSFWKRGFDIQAKSMITVKARFALKKIDKTLIKEFKKITSRLVRVE